MTNIIKKGENVRNPNLNLYFFFFLFFLFLLCFFKSFNVWSSSYRLGCFCFCRLEMCCSFSLYLVFGWELDYVCLLTGPSFRYVLSRWHECWFSEHWYSWCSDCWESWCTYDGCSIPFVSGCQGLDSVGCLWLLMLCGFCFVDLLRLVQCGGSEAASTLLLDQCHVIWECFWVSRLQQVAYVSSTYKCFITRSYVEMGWIVLIVMASVCDIILSI